METTTEAALQIEPQKPVVRRAARRTKARVIYSVALRQDQHKALTKLAVKRDVPMAQLIRGAIDLLLNGVE